MKKLILAVISLMLVFAITASGLASSQYIIPDSDKRQLTREELWTWDYESLGYILNEIFARHGYVFEPGGRYDNYFSAMNWYTPNSNSNNHDACYPQLNSTEWYNEKLVKSVRQEMRDLKTKNKQGKSLWDHVSYGWDALQGFKLLTAKSGQKWPVYSAPDKGSWRGAKGKAAVSTNDVIYAAGWENNWLLVMYETNNGSIRVGYVPYKSIKGKVNVQTQLNFAYTSAEILTDCTLTDDPARSGSSIVKLSRGERVTYLSTYWNRSGWAYVETEVGGQVVRGFIPQSAIDADDAGEGDAQIEDYEDDDAVG